MMNIERILTYGLVIICCIFMFSIAALPGSIAFAETEYKLIWMSLEWDIAGYEIHYKTDATAPEEDPFDGTGAGQGASPITLTTIEAEHDPTNHIF